MFNIYEIHTEFTIKVSKCSKKYHLIKMQREINEHPSRASSLYNVDAHIPTW